jgi:hypothetical protein
VDIRLFWKDVLSQNQQSLRGYFHEDAVIRWHCSNELFTVPEYIRANCEYPGQWAGEIERVEESAGLIITAVRVFPADNSSSFHVVSFCKIKNGLIAEMDEYWADDGVAPEWRRRMNIGKPLR